MGSVLRGQLGDSPQNGSDRALTDDPDQFKTLHSDVVRVVNWVPLLGRLDRNRANVRRDDPLVLGMKLDVQAETDPPELQTTAAEAGPAQAGTRAFWEKCPPWTSTSRTYGWRTVI